MPQGTDALINALADRLDTRCTPFEWPLLIAVDGKSGVGKSTFAKRLAERFDAVLVPGDDFYVGGTDLRDGRPEQLADLCIDRRRLKSVLQELKSNRPARYTPVDWDALDGGPATHDRTVYPRPILVLEGVYSNHPDLREVIDVSILLCVPESERKRRLLAREGEITDWERQWHRAEAWYFQNLARPGDFDHVATAH